MATPPLSKERQVALGLQSTPNGTGCAFAFVVLFTVFWTFGVVTIIGGMIAAGQFQWLQILFMVPFVIVSIGMTWLTFYLGRQVFFPPPPVDPAAMPRPTTVPGTDAALPSGSVLGVRLVSEDWPAAVFIGMVLVAGFWNGIVSVFVVKMVEEFAQNKWSLFGACFLTPFVLIGLCLLWGVGYTGYQLVLSWLVRPIWVEVDAHPLRIGREFGWMVQQTGVMGLRNITLELTCIESATYQQGTSTRTDTHTAQKLPLPSISEDGPPRGLFAVPADVMHTFASGHNQITWKVTLSGTVLFGLRYSTTFPVTMAPPGLVIQREVSS